MNIGKTVYFTDREEWRKWLSENYDKEKEIWLIYPKKASGNPRIPMTTPWKKPSVLAGLTALPSALTKTVMLNASRRGTPKLPIQSPTSSG
jgi:hypothetical protein